MKTHNVTLLSATGKTEPAVIEAAPGRPVSVTFRSETFGEVKVSEADAFECLVKLRLMLEARHYKILCNAARINVYPSRMARQMGGGWSAYLLTMGRAAKLPDLVDILDPAAPETIASVQAQREFYDAWTKSVVAQPKARPQEITPDLIEAAKKIPNGYVYKIDGQFGPNEAVPPEAIMGAWKVNSAGNIVGDFIPNANYQTKLARDLANTPTSRPKNGEDSH